MSPHPPNFNTHVLGRRLRQARLWAGIAQYKLGVAIGLDESCSSARISRYETGTHEPSIATARRLAEVLNVPLVFLYCEDEELAKLLLHLHRAKPELRRRIMASADQEWPPAQQVRRGRHGRGDHG